MLDTTSIKLLQKNGYKVIQSAHSIVVTHSNFDQKVLVVLGILMVLSSLLFMLFFFPMGVLILIFSIFILRKQGRKSIGSSSFTLDLKERRFVSEESRWGRMSRHFDDVGEIGFRASFFDEYATADKETTKEYIHDVVLKLRSHHKITLFRLKGDYLEPQEELYNLVDQLKSIFRSNE